MGAHLASCHLWFQSQPEGPSRASNHGPAAQGPPAFETHDAPQHEPTMPIHETSVNSSLDSSFDSDSPEDLENSLNSSCSDF